MQGERGNRGRAASLERSRLGLLASLVAISIVLAVSVSLMIPGLLAWLPRVEGLKYEVVQFGLVALVLVFAFYAFERERQLKKLSEALQNEQEETGRMGARLELLQAVQTERDTVSAVLVASADGILVVDRDRRVGRLNPALEAMVGWTESEVSGFRCEDLFRCRGDGPLACGTCPFDKVLMTGQPVHEHSIEATRKDGTTAWITGSYAPVRGASGDILLGVATLRDSTQQKEMEQLQHDFVSIVSHELRGPLTAIKGFVKTLLLKRDKLSDEAQTEFLGTINEQADRLNQLVEDLLNVSRIDTRRMRLTFIDIELEARIHKLIGQFSSKWGHRDIVVDIDPTLPLVKGDEGKMDEILINLIDNAVKYSPNGGTVRISARHLGDEIEVSIEDSGIGISPDDAARLFQKFHRIATPETRDIGGTGLGLYIVKNLVEAHGGNIFVTSVVGSGSTFTFTLRLDWGSLSIPGQLET